MSAIKDLIAISRRFLKTAKQDGWPVGDLTKAIQDAETELAAKEAVLEAARVLVTKWQEEGDADLDGFSSNIQWDRAVQRCADELAAALHPGTGPKAGGE